MTLDNGVQILTSIGLILLTIWLIREQRLRYRAEDALAMEKERRRVAEGMAETIQREANRLNLHLKRVVARKVD